MYVRILKKLSKYNKVNYERSNTPFLENYKGLNYSCSTNYYTNWLKMFRRSWGLYTYRIFRHRSYANCIKVWVLTVDNQ